MVLVYHILMEQRRGRSRSLTQPRTSSWVFMDQNDFEYTWSCSYRLRQGVDVREIV